MENCLIPGTTFWKISSVSLKFSMDTIIGSSCFLARTNPVHDGRKCCHGKWSMLRQQASKDHWAQCFSPSFFTNGVHAWSSSRERQKTTLWLNLKSLLRKTLGMKFIFNGSSRNWGGSGMDRCGRLLPVLEGNNFLAKIKCSRGTERKWSLLGEYAGCFWEKKREIFKQEQKWGWSSHQGVLAVEVEAPHFASINVGQALTVWSVVKPSPRAMLLLLLQPRKASEWGVG